jgi:uncharacterized protein involved in exopolysaccharide biosynthesis
MENNKELIEQELDVRALIGALWDGKLVIIALTLLGSVVAIVYALLATPIYRSEVLVQPRLEAKGGGGLGGLGFSFGGLADLAGFPFAAGGDRAVAIATLRSRALIETFIRENQLLPKLYESAWDSNAKNWNDPDPKNAPTVWEAYNDFTSGILIVTEDKKTGLVTVAVEWKDPQVAAQWANDLVARANAHMRAVAIREGERNLAYLEGQSRQIGQVELREALYGLVEAELKKLMLAKGGDEFAFKTIDPAVVPERKIRPKRRQIAILGFLAGGFSGVLFVLGKLSLRR